MGIITVKLNGKVQILERIFIKEKFLNI